MYFKVIFLIKKFLSGKNQWSEMFVMKEGVPIWPYWDSILVDEIRNDNLDLLEVPQYGRNLNETGWLTKYELLYIK